MKKILFVLLLAGCTTQQRAMIDAATEENSAPAGAPFEFIPTCEGITVNLPGYTEDTIVWVDAGDEPIIILHGGDSYTWSKSYSHYGISVWTPDMKLITEDWFWNPVSC